jgi:hypothetical protein
MNNIKFKLQESLQRLDVISSSRMYVSENKRLFPSLPNLPISSLVQVVATVVCVRCDINGEINLDIRTRYQQAAVSEFSYILGQESQCRDIFVRDNFIFAVFETPLKSHIKNVIDATARINAFKKVINKKLGGSGTTLDTLVSVSFDSLELQVVPCPRQDAQVQNLVWTGKAIHNVIKMCEDYKNEHGVLIESIVYDNLDDEDKTFFEEKGDYYISDFVNTLINNWIKNN